MKNTGSMSKDFLTRSISLKGQLGPSDPSHLNPAPGLLEIFLLLLGPVVFGTFGYISNSSEQLVVSHDDPFLTWVPELYSFLVFVCIGVLLRRIRGPRYFSNTKVLLAGLAILPIFVVCFSGVVIFINIRLDSIPSKIESFEILDIRERQTKHKGVVTSSTHLKLASTEAHSIIAGRFGLRQPSTLKLESKNERLSLELHRGFLRIPWVAEDGIKAIPSSAE